MVIIRQSLLTSYKLIIIKGSKGNKVKVNVRLVYYIYALRVIKAALKWDINDLNRYISLIYKG